HLYRFHPVFSSASFVLPLFIFHYCLFLFTYTPTTEIYTLSLHDALPIYAVDADPPLAGGLVENRAQLRVDVLARRERSLERQASDRKSTRLNSSHVKISYAVFCLKKKKKKKKKKKTNKQTRKRTHTKI